MNRILFDNYDFAYLGFEVSIYPDAQLSCLSILIYDPLHGTKTFNYSSEEITEDVMQFAMGKVYEQIANDEEM